MYLEVCITWYRSICSGSPSITYMEANLNHLEECDKVREEFEGLDKTVDTSDMTFRMESYKENVLKVRTKKLSPFK